MIKKTISAIVLSIGIYGCGSQQFNVNEAQLPHEEYNIHVNVQDGRYKCNEALVRMNPRGYSIECDWNHRFRGTHLFNALYWDDAAWYDEDKDGDVETFMGSNGEYYDATNLPGATQGYQELLEEINQNQIDYLWYERWRNK